MFIIVRVIITSRSPVINLLYSPYYFDVFHLVRYHSIYIFNGLLLLVRVMISHVFLSLHLWLFLFCILLSSMFGHNIQMLLWLTVRILQVLVTCRYNMILIRVWCVNIWPFSTNDLHLPISFMHLFGQKQDISEFICSY